MELNIEQRDKIRYKFLEETYFRLEADTGMSINLDVLGEYLNIDLNETRKAYQFLIDEGYLSPFGSGRTVNLTHHGIKTVESIKRKITFDEKDFSSLELYQLKQILEDLKIEISTFKLGQEIIFNSIDELFEQSKNKSKITWKSFAVTQIKDWFAQKIIDVSAKELIERIF